MSSCSECGSEVAGSDTFCRNCGHNLAKQATDLDSQDGEPILSTPTNSAESQTGTLQSRLQEMDDYDFEHFVADLWERMGWNTEVSQASVDAGIDVVATKKRPYPEKKIIQAKRYSNPTTVGGPDVQQYASLKHQVANADSVIIVTTSSFTNSAEARAEELNVKLVDGDDLVAIVNDCDAYDLVNEYLDIQQLATTSDSTTGPNKTVNKTTYISQTSDEDSRFDRWHLVALTAGVLTYAATNVSSLLFGILLLTTGITMYLDIRNVRNVSSWNPRAWLYLPGLLLALLSLPVYLVNRYRYLS